MKKIISLCTLVGALVSAHAQNEAKPAAAAAAPAAPPPQTTGAPPATATAPPAAPATNQPPAATTNAPAAPTAATANIRFQFEGMPYAEVLQRFAQMVGKPLISETNLEGTLTYTDPRAYNYTEALDTLNLILAMKDVTLLESGRYLRLIPMQKLSQMPLPVYRGLDKTGDVHPGEVITVVLELKNLDAGEIAIATTNMLSNAGSVAPLSRGRGLIITDRLANIQRVRNLIQMIDTESAVERQMRTFTLLHASGAVLSDLINRTFGVSTAPKRTQLNPESKKFEVLPADPNDYVTAVFDEASRTLVLFGPRERVTLAEEMITRFEQKEGARGGEVRIFYPRTLKPDELARMVREAVPGVAAAGETAATAATKARLIVDASTGRLIVTAPIAGQLDSIEQVVQKIDGSSGDGGYTRSETVQVTRVFRPRTGDVTTLAKVITDSTSRRTPAGTIEPTVNVTVDPGTQSVVVTGSPGQVEQVSGLLAQLESGLSPTGNRQTRFIDVGGAAEAQRLSPLVEQIYKSQLSSTAPAAERATILSDPDAGRLIVTGPADHLTRIEEVVAQLRAGTVKAEARQLRMLPLENLKADAALGRINELVKDRMRERPFKDQPPPSVIADAPQNRLLVTATDAQFEEIRKVVQLLDVVVGPGLQARHFKTLELFGRKAAEVVTLVQQLYQEQRKGLPEPAGGNATILTEEKSNQIMVSGPEDEIARVEAIVRQLDPAGKAIPREETRVVRLRNGVAADLATLVETSMNAQRRQVKVLLDARSNSLVVTGGAESVEAAAQIIEQLDSRPNAQPRQVRVLDLRSADAATVAPVITELLGEQVREQRGSAYVPQTKIVPDSAANRLIVTGPNEELDQVAALVEKFDHAPKLGGGTRVFPLRQAEASVLAPIVSNAMVTFDSRNQPIQRVSVAADPKSNSLVVSGNRADLQDVALIIERLDLQGTSSGRTFRVVDVAAGSATQLVELATRIFTAQNQGRPAGEEITVTADPSGNRVIVVGPEPRLNQAEALVASLNTRREPESRNLEVLELKRPNAAEIVPVVTRIYTEQAGDKYTRPPTLFPDGSGRRLTVISSVEQLELIKRIVSTLEDGDKPQPRQTKLFQVGKASEVQRLLPLVQQLYQDQIKSDPATGPADAQFLSDPRLGQIIVSARTEQLPRIEELLNRLRFDDSKDAVRSSRSFDVGSPEAAQRLLPLVQQLYQDQWKDRTDNDPADAQILADPPSARLIATGRASHLERIAAIVAQFEQGSSKPDGQQTRVFQLKTSSATDLANTIRTLYDEQRKGRPSGAHPLILPDTTGNRLIVSGPSNEVTAVEAIVRTLDDATVQNSNARAFTLKNALAQDVATVLTSAFVQFDSAGRSIPRLSAAPDRKSNTILVTGEPKDLQAASLIIEQLDSTTSSRSARQMRILSVTNGPITDIAARVRQLFQDNAGRLEDGTPEPLILEDARSHQLIVTGTTNQLARLEEIVTQLQAQRPSQAGRQTRLFDVGRPEEAQRLLPVVQQLYQAQWKGREDSDPADAQFLAENQRLVVTAKPEHLDEITAILGRLREDKNQAPPETRVYDLKTASATELAATANTLFREQIKAQGRPTTALILPDPTGNRIIVSATTNELAAIDEIVRKLDQVTAQTGGTRVFRLKSASADQIASMLSSSLATYRPDGMAVPRISVGADAKSRTLIVSGDPKDLQSAAVIIEQLDSAPAPQPRSMRIVAVQNGVASQVATQVKQLYLDHLKGRPADEAPEALVLGDNVSNRLILTGSDEQLKAIEEIVARLQEGPAGTGRQLRIFPIRNNSAAAVATVITQIFTNQLARQDPGQRLTVTATPDDRTLLVDATGVTSDQIEKLIRTLDSLPADGQVEVRTVHLQQADPDDIAEAVNKTLDSRPGSGRRVRVTPVAGASSLLLDGPAEAMQQVLQIIKELDTESTSTDIKVRIYKIENGNVREVSNILEQLLQTSERRRVRRGRGGPPANIARDEKSNRLIVSGTDSTFKLVDQVLPLLDQAPDRADRDVQFVWLQRAEAADVVSKVEAIFQERPRAERPLVEADAFSNSITLIGRRPDLVQAQEIIKRLDEASVDTSLHVRLLPIGNVPAAQMAAMLENIYPQMYHTAIRLVEKLPAAQSTNQPALNQTPPPANPPTNQPTAQAQSTNVAPEVVIAVDKKANALLLAGPSHELDKIERLVTELSFTFLSNDAEFRQFTLKEADPVVVARTLTDLFKQEPVRVQEGNQSKTVVPQPKFTVVAESRTRSIIVRAQPADFPLLESLILQLDMEGYSSQLEFRVIPVKNVRPDKLLPLVTQMVTQLTIVRPGEPLTITADTRSRGLLVVGRDNIIDRVTKLVESLDTVPGVGEAEVLLISLKKANASQLAAVLQAMLKPNAQGEATVDALELQEQVRRLRIQNDQGQAVVLDLSKPIKIMADASAGQSAGGNRLILTSTPDNLKALAAVVEMMDRVAIIEGVSVRLVALKHADATTVAQTLTTVFQQGKILGTGPGVNGQPEGTTGKALVNPLNVAVDPRSNSLILSGQAESIELANRIITDLDQQLERFVTDVRLFRLKHASATRLAPLLQAVFAEGGPVPGSEGLNTQVTRLRAVLEGATPKNTEQPKVRAALTIQADDASNIIIVAARSDVMPLFEAVLNGLDIPSASGMDSVRIYPLQHADAATLLQVLTDLYSTAKVPYLRAEDRPNVTVDDRTNALIVTGNVKSFAFIESLITQLDRALEVDLRSIRIIPLEKADAVSVAASLQKLLDARLSQKASQARSSDRLKVLVMGDPRLNSLLVAGSQESFELVQTLAKELDKAGPGLAGSIRLVPLKNADARTLSASLNTLFTQRYQNAQSPDVARNRPIIIPDPRSNSLLVAAGVEDNQSLDQLVQQLDRTPAVPSTIITVLPLHHHDATVAASTLQTIFAERLQARTPPGESPPPQDRVSIQADPINNALIVSSSQENLELIQGLLQKIDIEPTAEGGLVQAFPLKYADAQRVATMLRSLVDQGLYRPGTGAKPAQRTSMAVTIDPPSNTLIVSASPENMLLVQELIQKIDSKEYGQEGNIRLYPLKYVRASHVATVLDQFFKAKRTAESTGAAQTPRSLPVTIIPDDRTQTLLVTGGKESFEAVDRMLAQLDVADNQGGATFRVFALKNATASKLEDTLTRLLAKRPTRIRGEPPEPVNIIADSWANALIVTATPEDLVTIASLIETLDNQQATAETEVEIYSLAKADARRVAETVRGLYRDGAPGTSAPVAINVDERLNALVVSAGQVDRQRIADLVRKLDTEEVSKVSEIKVFPLHFARAQSLSTILNAALNTKTESLTEQSPNTQSVLQFITRSPEGRELVTSALRERVLITPDPRMNSLIVSAPLDFMQLLEPIVQRLDSESPQMAKIKVFNLKNADVRQMSEILTELFKLQRAATTPLQAQQAGSERSVQYTLIRPKIGPDGVESEEEAAAAVLGSAEEAALTVTVDPRTNSLLIGGTDHYVTLAGQLIETLDSSPVQERVSQVYRLRNAAADKVQLALRSFLDQDRQRVVAALGPEAVGTAQRMLEREVAIVAEPISNTLLLSASPRYFSQVETLIHELDQPLPQVLIQCILAEVLLDNTRELGVEWNYNPKIDGRTVFTGTDFGVAADLANFGGFSSMITGSDYTFLLRALEADGRLEVLSRPQILTADNQEASINIGQRVPLVTDSRVTAQGDTVTSFQYQNVGVSLSVTPRISPDGVVKMDVGTTNSALSSQTQQVSPDVVVPIINERRATTTVSVQSGQSIIIGGLISSSDDNRSKKIPFLGDIPLLGVLFRSTRYSTDRKELLIVMTPQVLTKIGEEGLALTRTQLDRSNVRTKTKRDEFQKQILQPLYPDDPNFNSNDSRD